MTSFAPHKLPLKLDVIKNLGAKSLGLPGSAPGSGSGTPEKKYEPKFELPPPVEFKDTPDGGAN